MTEPTDDEINRAIAERVMGYERLPWPAVPEYQKPGPNGVECLYAVPDFCNDEEALNNAMKCLPFETGIGLAMAFKQIELSRGEPVPTATKAEALLRAVGGAE